VTIEAVREETRALTPSASTVRASRARAKKTLNQTREFQKGRRATEASHLREAAALFQMHKNRMFPTIHPKMASFFQLPKSRPSSTAGTT